MLKTHQQVFDVVASHLLSQGKCSILEAAIRESNLQGFAYYGEDGCKCSIGALIPDEVYSSKLEGWAVSTTMLQKVLRRNLSQDIDVDFLYRLQGVHDGYPPNLWYINLNEIAVEYGLKTDVVDKYEIA